MLLSTFEHSLAMNGENGYVAVGAYPELDLNDTGEFTIEAWVRPTALTGLRPVVSKGYNSSYSLMLNNGKIRALNQESSSTVRLNIWSHVAVTWEEGGQQRYYINGDWVGSDPAGPTPLSNGMPLLIGAELTLLAQAPEFAGNIAEVRLWDRARGKDEIRRTMHVAIEEPLPGLVANWHLADNYEDALGVFDAVPAGFAYLSGPEAPPKPAVVPVDQFYALPWKLRGAASAYVPELDRVLLIGGERDGWASGQIGALNSGSGVRETLPAVGSVQVVTHAAAAYVPDGEVPGGNRVYVFGGQGRISDGFFSRSNRIYSIDPVSGASTRLPEQLSSSLTLTTAVHHPESRRIYLFGGDQGSYTNRVQVFDPASETIRQAGFPLPRVGGAMASIYSSATDKVYLFGGRTTGSWSQAILAVPIDPDRPTELLEGQQIEEVAELPQATDYIEAIEDPETNLIYLLASGTDGNEVDRLWVFDPVTEEIWETSIYLHEKRARASLVYDVNNRHALVLGGEDDAGEAVDKIWRIPLGDGPAVPLGRWDFPEPAYVPDPFAIAWPVSDIDGSGDTVVVGTDGSGAFVYHADGSRTQYDYDDLGTGRVTSVAYNPANGNLNVGTWDRGVFTDYGSGTRRDFTSLTVHAIDYVPEEHPWAGLVNTPFYGTDEGLWHLAYPPGGTPGWRQELAHLEITAIAHRGPHDLWVTTPSSLWNVIYDQFGVVVSMSILGNVGKLTRINDLVFSDSGDFWITSDAGGEFTSPGILRLPAAQVPDINKGLVSAPLIGDHATAVDIGSDGRIWVSIDAAGSDSGGVVQYERVETLPGSGEEETATSEFNWAGSAGTSGEGIVYAGPLGSSRVTFGGTVWDNSANAIGAVEERIWIGRDRGELVTYAPRWQQIDESNNIGDEKIRYVSTVRGRLFAATSTSLHVLQPDGRTWDNHELAVSSDVVADSQDRIWVGTYTGPQLYTPDGWDDLTDRVGDRPDDRIYALAEDHDGRIWIGSREGLTLFDRDRFVHTFTTVNSELPSNNVWELLVDRENRLWIGTGQGLAVLDGNDWTAYTPANSNLSRYVIRDLVELSDGTIAVSTSDGLDFFDGTTFTAQALPMIDADDLHLAVDELGRLWVGNAVLTETGWQVYHTTNSGLASPEIYDVATDAADRVWFSHFPDTGLSVRGTTLPPLANVLPEVDEIQPTFGSAGDEIKIIGGGFGNTPSDVSVTIGGASTTVVTVQNGEIRVRLNANNVTGPVMVTRGGRTAGLLNNAFCAEPTIVGITPTNGSTGTIVEITGTNFDPAVRATIGNGEERLLISHREPTLLRVIIEAGDPSGFITVHNTCADTKDTHDHTATSTTSFTHLDLDVETVQLNQGMEAYGLAANKPTMVQTYITRDVVPVSEDSLRIDAVEVTFSRGSLDDPDVEILHQETVDLIDASSGLGDVPPSNSRPFESWRTLGIADSLNVTVTPRLGVDFTEEETIHVTTRLLRTDREVGIHEQQARFRPDATLRVLLVPIMRNRYLETEVVEMMADVDGNLDQMRRRIWPTGRINTVWSSEVYTVEDVITDLGPFGGDLGRIDIGDNLEFYDATHDLDRARERFNRNNPDPANFVIGVVQGIDLGRFDASLAGTDLFSNTITLSAPHHFVTGQPVWYSNGGGTDIGGLTDAARYYAIRIDERNVQLAATQQAALAASPTPILLSPGVSETHTLLALDAIDPRAEATGKGFGTHLIGQLASMVLDTACEAGNFGVQVATFGLLGSDDGCSLEMPSRVAWAVSNSPRVSSLFSHELGHTVNLVDSDAPNGANRDNPGHSVNDEMGSNEDPEGDQYNSSKVLWWQPGVTDPIVDPITEVQFLANVFSVGDRVGIFAGFPDTGQIATGTPHNFNAGQKVLYQLGSGPGIDGLSMGEWYYVVLVDDGAGGTEPQRFQLSATPEGAAANPPELVPLFSNGAGSDHGFSRAADQNTVRAKAIMSYAEGRNDDRSFFEPVDVVAIYQEFAPGSAQEFVRDLREEVFKSADARPAKEENRPATLKSTPLPPPPTGTRLYISGYLDRGDGTGEIPHVEDLGLEGPIGVNFAGTGYSLVQLNASGKELRETGIWPMFRTFDGDTSEQVGFFSAKLAAAEGVLRVELRQGEQVLDVFQPGPAAPVVEITSLTGGSFGSKEVSVSWEAFDADGDNLHVAVLYSPDNGQTWATVASREGEESGTVAIPVSRLVGSDEARFRVVASDGFHTGSDLSTSLKIFGGAPIVSIGYPTANATLMEGRPPTLAGAAFYLQTGPLPDGDLRWSSDRDGDLGSGPELRAILSVGSHRITLEATGDNGLTAMATTNVTVVGDYDSDGISDARERSLGLDPIASDLYSDADGDGLYLPSELARGLDPNSNDTDGDGRTDVQEIADGTAPGFPDDLLPADRLQVFPASLGFESDRSLGTALPQQFVQIVSQRPADWTLTADVEWLSASAATGQTLGGVTILVDAFMLSDGLHEAELTFTSEELGSSVVVPVTVQLTNSEYHYDVNGDGQVDEQDFQEVTDRKGLGSFDEGYHLRYDIDRDGMIDGRDQELAAGVVFSAEVVGRHVFYNNSMWDGNDSRANASDDSAMATDPAIFPDPLQVKRALLPGETATAANYTSYSKGLNGMMVDIAGLAGTPTADDFLFRVGNISDPGSWQPTSPPTEVDVRADAGVDGSDRVTLAWKEGAVTGGWLEVTVLPKANTGLDEPDVFYFANMPGDANGDGATDLSDFNLWNATKFTQAGLDALADFDRSGAVDLSDFNIWNAHKFTSAPAPPAVHDAVLEQAAIRGPESFNLGEAVWLHEFERTLLSRREDNDGNRVEEAVDKLLATYWP